MTLRRKTVVIVAITLIGLMVFLYGISRIFLLDSFAELEEHHTRQEVDRALRALLNDLSALDRTTGDYGAWDRTYQFMADHNEDFLKTELKIGTIAGLRINLVMIFDLSGRMIFSKCVDLKRNRCCGAAKGIFFRPWGPSSPHQQRGTRKGDRSYPTRTDAHCLMAHPDQ